MKLHNELPVYKATYDMLLEIFQLCRGFSREYKFTVGESLKKETIDLLTLIFRANSPCCLTCLLSDILAKRMSDYR